MAVCEYCGKDMLRAHGCKRIPIIHNGKEYEPIKVGDPDDWLFGAYPNERCNDCNAKVGHYHHPGCDAERCPVCGGQLLMCGCQDLVDPDAIEAEIEAIKKSFSKETCYGGCEWSEERPSTGHCAVATMILYENVHGQIGRIKVNGISHYFNVLPSGKIIDLTADQFDETPDYKDYETVEFDYFLKNAETALRYRLFKDRYIDKYIDNIIL